MTKNTATEPGLEVLRRSAALLVAHAACELDDGVAFGGARITEDGFTYDVLGPSSSRDDLLAALAKGMQRAVSDDLRFACRVVDRTEAQRAVIGQRFLLDRIAAEPERTEWRVCQVGLATDLVDGDVVESAGRLNESAFRLLDVSGAYWRGDEEQPQLQRVHGTIRESPAALEADLAAREEARSHDHRVIGERLDLFAFDAAIGPGLPIWLPDGQTIRDELERWAEQTERAWGYRRISTPHITRSELYEVSGHLPYFADDIFPPMETDAGVSYRLRPMNCPHHMAAYASRPHSYRELPLRFAEYGSVYRYERSGELNGLMRVRGMTQNDAHIFCRIDDALDEFVDVMRLHAYYYGVLGIEDYHMVLALRDPENRAKYHDDEEMWATAERITREAMEISDIDYVEEPGGAAHYGPKVDFMLRSVTGRDYGASTNQLDLYLPMRFDLSFTNERNEPERPVVIHRAPLGSHERFIGFLIEHYDGAFPPWLAPVQVAVVPVGEDHVPWAHQVTDALFGDGRRVAPVVEGATVGATIAASERRRIPFAAVVGNREVDAGTVSIRARGGEQLGTMTLDEFRRRLTETVDQKVLSAALV